jgi:GNAT superfamily N-acetyltransferase
MHTENFKIRKIEKAELSLIRDLPPPDWRIDLEKVYAQHYDQDYFYPIVTIMDSEIIGTGIAVVNDNATWLGTIIVKENFRNNGIGKAITNHLINYSKSKGIDTIILAASESGLPVYRKIGFEPDIDYLFFKTDTLIKIDSASKNISEITKEDHLGILELDFALSGERREKLLTHSLKTGFKYKDKILKGYYLPDFGTGLIIADSEISGLELLRFRLSGNTSPICVPETNETAIGYLKSIGYYQYFKTPRMFLNKNVKWHPENIYSRGCGYLG